MEPELLPTYWWIGERSIGPLPVERRPCTYVCLPPLPIVCCFLPHVGKGKFKPNSPDNQQDFVGQSSPFGFSYWDAGESSWHSRHLHFHHSPYRTRRVTDSWCKVFLLWTGVALFSQKQDDEDADDDLEIAIDNTAFMDEFFAEVRSQGRERYLEFKVGPNNFSYVLNVHEMWFFYLWMLWCCCFFKSPL